MHKSYTAVVVGLGVVGSATLWRLAQQQQDVLGLEAARRSICREVPMVARGYFARRTGKVRITYHFWRKRIWAGESCKRLATGHCCITAGGFSSGPFALELFQAVRHPRRLAVLLIND